MTKTHLSDMAVIGGSPEFREPLYVNAPNAASREAFEQRLDRIWAARWFTNDGPMVQELEARLAEYLEVDHCVLTSSGTSGMAILLRALGLSGEVILPSFTFVSTAHLLSWIGIRPVFADIVPARHDLDPQACRDRLGPETSAIIATHIWGRACQVEALQGICDEAGIPLILDAAHAFGASHRGRPIGGFGRAEVFSFHATKAFHTFEGGAITTGDPELAASLRKLRNFGFTHYDQVDCVGTNAKMSEVHAAMGLANLDIFDQTTDHARSVFRAYERGLADIAGLTLLRPDPGERANFHYVPVLVDSQGLGFDRDTLLRILHAEQVIARRYFYPGTHALDCYRETHAATAPSLPATVEAGQQIIVLPGGASLDVDAVDRLCGVIRFAAAHARDLNTLRLEAELPATEEHV